MKETISALVDDELDEQAANALIATLSSDEALKSCWDEYHLIGDAMRTNSQIGINVRQQVAQRLAEEPTVLALRRWFGSGHGHGRKLGAVALAASVSFAAVVAWQQLAHNDAAVAVVADRGVPVTSAVATPAADDPYLLAHQEMTADQNIQKVSYGNGAGH